jgi:hypothetical protein
MVYYDVERLSQGREAWIKGCVGAFACLETRYIERLG